MRLGRRHLLAAALVVASGCAPARPTPLLNVSFDPTREFFRDINHVFAAHWAVAHGGAGLSIDMSNGGSGRQAHAVIAGLKADVVTLAEAFDVDQIAQAGLIDPNWRTRLPHNSAPYSSTVVFLVRSGNPKSIRDWSDLTQAGLNLITPNPKTSGGARWNYLAAWAYALAQRGGDAASAHDFVARLYSNVSVLDSGARAATTTFVERGIGDVLITWESEALLAVLHAGDKVEMVTPSRSILAEPSVAWVDRNVAERGTSDLAQAYLHFLYDAEAQEIAARHFFRPTDAEVLVAHREFADIPLATVDGDFGGWAEAYRTHFAENAVFDQIMGGRRS